MSTWRSVRAGAAALAATLMLALTAAPATAQTYQGAVRGLIKDAQGVIPGVEVTLTNEDTNAARTTATNNVGEYAFASVLPGTYSIKVSLAGFKTEERRGLRIATQQQVQLDFTLEVGNLAEQITVTAQAPLIERATASRSTTMTAEDINALPIFGRNTFFTTIQTPNVVQTGDPLFVRYQDQSGSSLLSMGGGPRRGNAYMLEGVSLTDFSNRAAWVPSAEAISDMRVQVKTYDAEMGRAAGGAFNVTAKSGSNDLHGSALFLNKPGWGTGNLFYNKLNNIPKPPQYYYNWAGSVGGPLVRNKTFFWFSTDDYVQQSTRNIAPQFPTALERAGDFSQTFNAAGQLVTIYDPATTRTVNGQIVRDPFPGNKIPTDRISPIALKYLAELPIPTNGRTLTQSAILNDGPQNQETLKLDQRWNDKLTTTGMYGHQYTKEPGTPNQGPFGTFASDSGGSLLVRPVHFIAVNQIIIPNNTTTLTFRYGINNFGNNTEYPAADGFQASSLGYPAYFTSQLSEQAYPSVSLTDYQGIGHSAKSSGTDISQTFNGTLTKLMGNHSVKMGADYRRIQQKNTPATNGSFSFTKAYTQLNASTSSTAAGDALASFLLGLPASGTYTVATPSTYTLDYASAYIQDDYRVSSKLTANFGLRYEYEPGVTVEDNAFISSFAFDEPFPIQVPGYNLTGGLLYAGVDGNDKTSLNQPLSGFAPRGGIAYSITDKQVIRGGYGFFWVPTINPSVPRLGYTATTSFVASLDGNTPLGTLADPYPSGILQPVGNSLGKLAGVGTAISFSNPDAKPGYVQQYSVDWQKEFAGGNVVSVGYMGSRSERLGLGATSDTSININQLDPQYMSLGSALNQSVPNPFFGLPEFAGTALGGATTTRGQLLRPYPQYLDISMTRNNVARARYNALVTQWNKRMSHGYSINVSHTWSDTKDNQFGEGNGFSSAGGILDNYNVEQEFGTSLQDLKHRLNASVAFQLPFGEGRKWLNRGGVANAVLGGWQVAVTGRWQTGFPLGMTQSSNSGFGIGQRPNVVPGVEVMTTGSQEERAVTGWFNPAAFSVAPAFTFGNSPRVNPDWRGPAQRDTALAISKSQQFANKTLQLRFDVLNLFDDPLLNAPNTTIGNVNFGKITSVGGYARSVQLQARLGF